jgi:hypothetical protein
MAQVLSFATVYTYDTREPGIDVPVRLQAGPDAVTVKAKVDTGSSNCIFERKHGERLGLDIETGIPQHSALSPEVLPHTATR